MNRLSITISSELSNINKVENFIDETVRMFELPVILRDKIVLPVIEAVNNSILYGNKQDLRKVVKLSAERDGQKVVYTVEDEGEGFDFNDIPDPTSPENISKVSGRGLFLIQQLTDDLSFAEGGARVIMTFFV